MYCSACGNEITKGLIFCNNCGFKLNNKNSQTRSPELSSNYLVSAIVSIFVIGFGCIVAILAIMKNLGFEDKMTAIVIALSFLTILFVESALVWLLVRLNRRHYKETEIASFNEPVNEFYTAPKRALGESTLPPVPSVVDNTTRNFEPLYRDSKTKQI